MKYRLSILLRMISGFLFCLLFFVGFVRFYCLMSYIWAYVASLCFAAIYVYSSFLAFRYQRHYFFEFKAEFTLKLLLIFAMFGSAIFLNSTFEIVIDLGNKYLLGFYFLLIYLGFDLISELALIISCYHNNYDRFAYRNKAKKIVKYIDQQAQIGNILEDKIGPSRRVPKATIFFAMYNTDAYDFFADSEGEFIAFYETDFYEELMQFSLENQKFYKKKIEDENYILDTRCNKVCITKDKFSFYDCNGKKCTFTMKFERKRLDE